MVLLHSCLQVQTQVNRLDLISINIKSNYQTGDQAKHIYKKVELGEIFNVNTMKKEIEYD